MNGSGRSAYLDASVATASGERLLVMLCDRLALDVRRAFDAQTAGAHDVAHGHLLHAQDIVVELQSSLRPGGWDGAAGLASLYDYLFRRLVHANTRRDLEATTECLGLAEDLRDTWHQAALNQAKPA